MTAPAPRIAWYGDDFTGAAAVAEVLAFAGLPAALFLKVPAAAQRARLGDLAAVGLAGTARAQTPDWMQANLPGVFDWLAATGAPLIHYKVCSTLDSAPEVGSIGKALDIGLDRLGADCAAILIASPEFGRYQVFGHLFAAGPGGIARLDRHPVMAAHPVTPMDEADVCRHLSRQTEMPLMPLTLDAMTGAEAAQDRFAALRTEGAAGIAIDTLDGRTQRIAGALIDGMRFVIGSQGVESALVAHWRETGWLGNAPDVAPPSPVTRIAAVSGSVSSVTAAQIAQGEKAGFRAVPLESAALVGADRGAAIDSALARASAVLADGGSPIVCTARGPDDPGIARLTVACRQGNVTKAGAETAIGSALGYILHRLIVMHGLTRVVVAGGDTSGRVLAALPLFALRPLAPISAGASLMSGVSDDPTFDGIEIVLKGGQMGPPDLFARAAGAAPAEPNDKKPGTDRASQMFAAPEAGEPNPVPVRHIQNVGRKR